jgi:hypothetical protein
MSGHKRATVSISQEEYDRLQEAESKLKNLPEPRVETRVIIQQQSSEVLRNGLAQLEQRQAAFDKMVCGMDSYIREVEHNTNQAMREVEARTIAEAQNYAGSLWNCFDQIISDQIRHFENVIEVNHRQNQEELAQISRQIRRAAGDNQRKREIAEEWFSAAEQFCYFINSNYAHEFFVPGRIEQLESQLNQCRHNLDVGLSEAVVVTAQQLYAAFSELRVDLERMQTEWLMLVQTAREVSTHELEQAQLCREITAIDLDGNPLPYDIATDYWTNGRLEEHIARVADIKQQLDAEFGLPDIFALRQLLDIDLPQFHRDLQDILFDGRVCALNSQLRINIADLVVRALQEQGFSLETSAYDQQDFRLGFGARLKNIEGNEVVLQVSPTGDMLGDNELDLQSIHGKNYTEHELRRRWYEVSRSLSAFGITVGQYEMVSPPVQRTARPPLIHGKHTGVRKPMQRSGM